LLPKDISDDFLTAIANGIIAENPALRLNLIEDPETGMLIDDERDYKPLRVRAAP
jgi:hypothetical protein